MAITLSQLCANTEKKYSMKLIAGHAGMGNTVRWAVSYTHLTLPTT